MKYQIGDKIIVLHSDEEGLVIDIINENMVMIEVRGVKFPAYMDQIDFPYFKMFTQKKELPKKKIYVDNLKKEKSTKKVKTADGVWLNFVPVYQKDVFDDDVVDKLKVYLINHEEAPYHFEYQLFFGGAESSFEHKGTIEPLSDFYLHDIDFDDISDNPKFEFIFSPKEADKKLQPYFEKILKTNGKKIFKRIQELQANHEASFQYELFLKYPEAENEGKLSLGKLDKAGFKVFDGGEGKSYMAPARSVVDLHIEKLVEKTEGLSNRHILELQMTEFEKYYHLAVHHHLKTFIAIHGIGNGRLRDEIHSFLKSRKEVKSFVNQYHKLYGFGATEIYFR